MSVSSDFSSFCSNLRMSDEAVSKIRNRFKQITKRINIGYWDSASETSNSLYVGSYGGGTEIWTSDIDIIVQLPFALYKKYDNYSSNGQSALLQDVKTVLERTYSTPHLKGDGQVIGINLRMASTLRLYLLFIIKTVAVIHTQILTMEEHGKLLT